MPPDAGEPETTARPGRCRAPCALLWTCAAFCAFAFAWFHVGTHLIYETNEDRRKSDQQAAIDLALESRADWYPHRTNAVSNNLFAWAAARLAWTGDEQSFFVRGKWLNLIVSGAVLMAGAGWLAGRWGALPALAVLGLGGFGAILPRAVYFQPEAFHYLAFAASCVAGFQLLRRNPLWLYGVFGAVSAVAFLAKPSNAPFLMVWFASASVRWVIAVLPGGFGQKREGWSPARHALGCILICAAAGGLLAPLGLWSARKFGAPFFNMTKYWMWQDDYGRESVPLLVQHGDARRIKALPEVDVPSAANYFRRHTAEQAFRRLADGTWGKLTRFMFPERKFVKTKHDTPHRRLLNYRGIYLAVLGAGALGLSVGAWMSRRRRREPADESSGALGWLWRPETAETVLVFGTFAGYLLAYGWYEPIGRGDRFMMTLYLPLVFWLCHVAVEAAGRLGRAGRVISNVLFACVTLGLARNIAHLAAWPVFNPEDPL